MPAIVCFGQKSLFYAAQGHKRSGAHAGWPVEAAQGVKLLRVADEVVHARAAGQRGPEAQLFQYFLRLGLILP
jgi:hypothetical protein